MKLYNNLYISENNQQNVAQFINYNTNIEKLSKDKNIEQKYRKKDGTLIKISIQPYSQDPKDKDLTIWMFTNENSADAVYGSKVKLDDLWNVMKMEMPFSNGQYKWVRSVGKPIL